MSIVLDGSNLTTTGVINSGTAVASTSGTSIDFTGIPSGSKRITVMYNGVSTNNTSNWLIQIGSGSIDTTGYQSTSSYAQSGNLASSANSTAGFLVTFGSSATYTHSGHYVLTLLGSNIWIGSGIVSPNTTYAYFGSGNKTLSGILDRLRITTVTPDTFDAGSVNILYE